MEASSQGWALPAPEPHVKMKVGGKWMNILVDTGASITAVNVPLPIPVKERVDFQGAPGIQESIVYQPTKCELRGRSLVEELVYLPQVGSGLKGWGALCKLRPQIVCHSDGTFKQK